MRHLIVRRPGHVRLLPLLLPTLASLAMLATTPAHAVAAAAGPRVELKPLRADVAVEPGSTATINLTIGNRLDEAVQVRLLAVDLEAGAAEGGLAAPAAGRGASAWVTFDDDDRRIPAGEVIRVLARVTVPAGTRPGSHALAIVASQRLSSIGSNTADALGSRVEVLANLGSTIVVDVAGDARGSARIVDVTSPRLVTSRTEPRFEVAIENDGELLLALRTKLEIPALGGFAHRTLRSDVRETLPGGRRNFTIRWTDAPWIGWFTPTLIVEGGTGTLVHVEQDVPTVFVLPPWWVLVLLAIALLLPLATRRRRRRRIGSGSTRSPAARRR